MLENIQLESEIKEADVAAQLEVPEETKIIIQEMMKAGLMYGHKKSKTNPHFRKYIHTVRNGIEIIDLMYTLEAIERTGQFLKEVQSSGKTTLFVATQPAAKEAKEMLVNRFGWLYINEKWIGGLITNFKVLSGRIDYFRKVKHDLEKGEFEKYTKKERVLLNKNIHRMRLMFSGLENLNKLPDVLFLIDTSIKGHQTALREARRAKIKTVAIVDSDDDPDLIDLPIPANDHAKSSIDWIVKKLVEAMESKTEEVNP